MKRLFQLIFSLTLLTAINVFVFGAHSSAMTMEPSHIMSGMKYTPASFNCVTLCTTSAASNKPSDIEDTEQDEDENKQSEPFYRAFFQSLTGLTAQHSSIARERVKFEPPPGLPAYIQFAVFRT